MSEEQFNETRIANAFKSPSLLNAEDFAEMHAFAPKTISFGKSERSAKKTLAELMMLNWIGSADIRAGRKRSHGARLLRQALRFGIDWLSILSLSLIAYS